MIVTFQSKASGDVIMFGEVARQMMSIMGKEASAQGIVTAEQLPDAIARLRAAVAQDKENHQRSRDAADAERAGAEPAPQFISLAQRAVPLLELLERSLRKGVPVVWGV